MLRKRDYFITLVCLLGVYMLLAYGLHPKRPASAQSTTNLQYHDISFNPELARIAKPPENQQIYIPNPNAFANGNDASIVLEQTEIEGAVGDEILYLPLINNNYFYIFDDFSNVNSGFPNIDTSTNTYQYLNGEYQILNKTSSHLGAVTAGHKLEEFEYEISMRRVGSARGFYGIVYWLDDTWNEYNLFMISPDTGKYYHYNYKSSSGFTLLLYSNHSSINLGNGVNRIRMRQHWVPEIGIGLFLEANFFINGYQMSFPVATLTGVNRIGFFAAPIDANHQVLFDDYLFKNYCTHSPGCPN